MTDSTGTSAGRPGAQRPADTAAALPLDTGVLIVPRTLPADELDSRHLLVLPDDVETEEVEALAVSQDARAGWLSVSSIGLMPGVELHGPWRLDDALRHRLDLPEWADQVMALACEPDRGGPLPVELAGLDPLADAFALHQPEGTELLALQRLRAIARRLRGGLRLVGDGIVPELHVPDPDEHVGLTLVAPVWLAPDALEALLADVAPGSRAQLDVPAPAAGETGLAALDPEERRRLEAVLGAEALDKAEEAARHRAAAGPEETVLDGYAVHVPGAGAPDGSVVELRVQGVEALPLALRGEPWAAEGSLIAYQGVWRPLDPASPDGGERAAAGEVIEAVTAAVQRAAGGAVVDDDGFLVVLDPDAD
ncbi:hypothetical protein [Actinomyces radicidentis]|uniref:hypothetical protein n=1 Tax=Actinomyces radicidentis TaxID=111015 RepID=UPI0028EFF88B|nr:hypothetical protein [Actinomyces radicidentis]